MDGPAGGVSNRVRHGPIARRREIGPADRGPVAFVECRDEVLQPMGIRASVVIDVRDDLAGRGLQARVARAAQSAVPRVDEEEGIVCGDFGAGVGRPVVYDHHLVVRVIELEQSVQAVAQRGGPVAAAHDHRHARPLRASGKGDPGEGLVY